ncbi:hypothetical protein [Gordonia crocea]|uniref:Uncharacterized protein n=1 Tax=Gordonia crocea TaxID=589162 RepID=A0A7M3SUX0_9ACTN|nr:hypothetical protein [Gordonia crocea]GED96444.1 hypothetical protein nbrc107697_04830 [Gordonia crocea]
MPKGSAAISISFALAVIAVSLAIADGRHIEAVIAAIAWIGLFAAWLVVARRSSDDSLPDA